MHNSREKIYADLDRLYPVWETSTIWQRFQKTSALFPENDFLVLEDVGYTYSQAGMKIDRIAASLYRLGVRCGDHVALLLSNSPELVFLTFAIAKLGAAKVPLHTGIARRDFVSNMNKAGCGWLITRRVPDDALIGEVPSLNKVVAAEDNRLYMSDKVMYWSEFMRLCDEKAIRESEDYSAKHQNGAELCDIMFTSGSTANPKGVMLTHDMILRSAYGTCRTRCFEIGRRLYAPCPLIHSYSYIEGLMAILTVGGALLMSRFHFDAGTALSFVKQKRANDMIVLGNMMMKMLQYQKEHPAEFPDLYAANFGVETPDWIWNEVCETFDITDLTTGMGMTETSSCAVQCSPDTPREKIRDYDGRPKESGCAGGPENGGKLVAFRVVDHETGEDLPAGVLGEILYKGPCVTKGYYNDPELTRASFTKDGWLRSADIGERSEDGYLVYRGRYSEMIKINGENVSPAGIEGIISGCSGVRDAVVVGIPYPGCGEVCAVFVEAKGSASADPEEIAHYCRANLAKFQVPKYYIFLGSEKWPRTESNKPSRRAMSTLAQQMISEKDPRVKEF